jgi:hypothetical protein
VWTPVQVRLDRNSRPVDEQRQDVRLGAETKLQALAIGHVVDVAQALTVCRSVRMVRPVHLQASLSDFKARSQLKRVLPVPAPSPTALTFADARAAGGFVRPSLETTARVARGPSSRQGTNSLPGGDRRLFARLSLGLDALQRNHRLNGIGLARIGDGLQDQFLDLRIRDADGAGMLHQV